MDTKSLFLKIMYLLNLSRWFYKLISGYDFESILCTICLFVANRTLLILFKTIVKISKLLIIIYYSLYHAILYCIWRWLNQYFQIELLVVFPLDIPMGSDPTLFEFYLIQPPPTHLPPTNRHLTHRPTDPPTHRLTDPPTQKWYFKDLSIEQN